MFFLLSVYIWIQRPDLIGLSIISAFATLGISFLIYYINFNLFFPHFWDKYGMLKKPILGIEIMNIPFSEMLWHFGQCFVVCFGVTEMEFIINS